MTTKHTQGKLRRMYPDSYMISACGYTDTYVGDVWGPIIEVHPLTVTDFENRTWWASGDRHANADRIVLTWNCHDELVWALEKARVELEELTAEFMGENYNNPELNAALKLAKGE